MRLARIPSLLAVAVTWATGSSVEAAEPSLYFQEASVEVVPGGTFLAHLYVAVPAAGTGFNGELAGIDWFVATDITARGKLSILGRTLEFGLAPTANPTFPQSLYLQSTSPPEDYVNDYPPPDVADSLGGYFPTLPAAPLKGPDNPSDPPVSYLLSVLTMKVDDALAPGVYPLVTSVPTPDYGWFDTDFYSGIILDNALLHITVVPEPSEYAMAVAAGLLGLGLYRRWRAAA